MAIIIYLFNSNTKSIYLKRNDLIQEHTYIEIIYITDF